MKEKIRQLTTNLTGTIKPKLVLLDSKVTTFIPNPKLKKILYIGVGSLFGFMFLIILLGILLAPFRREAPQTLTTTKIVLPTSSPDEPVVLTETQKKILELETKIKELRFPEGILNIPVIESNISI